MVTPTFASAHLLWRFYTHTGHYVISSAMPIPSTVTIGSIAMTGFAALIPTIGSAVTIPSAMTTGFAVTI